MVNLWGSAGGKSPTVTGTVNLWSNNPSQNKISYTPAALPASQVPTGYTPPAPVTSNINMAGGGSGAVQTANVANAIQQANIVAPAILKQSASGGGLANSYQGTNIDMAAQAAFAALYPGFAQITPDLKRVDSASGIPANTGYVLNNGIRNVPMYGDIAPVGNFGWAEENPSLAKGLMSSILPAAGIMLGPLIAAGLGGMGPWGSALGDFGSSMELGGSGMSSGISNTASAVTSPYIDYSAGITGVPSGWDTSFLGSGSLIPDYTGGIGTNAGMFGSGITGTGGLAGAGGSLLSNLGTAGKVASALSSLFGGGGGSGGASGGNGMNGLLDLIQQLAGAGIGYASSDRLSQQLMHVAERAGQLGDPFQQQPRIPYQGQLAQLLTKGGADSFMSTDPGVLGMMDQARNKFQAEASKSGSGGTTYTDYLRNISDILGGQYNNRINQLATLGGFTMAPNAGGYGNIGSMAALYGSGGLAGLGSLLGGGTPTLNTLLNGGSTLFNGIKDIGSLFSDWFGGSGGSGSTDMTGFLNSGISNWFNLGNYD